MAKMNIDYYGDKKVNNAIKKLIKKYGWYTNQYLSWDWGHIFYQREYDEEHYTYYETLKVETNIDGISVDVPCYSHGMHYISFKELKLFKVISNYYKQLYEETQKIWKK